jgi:FkbM family methyltransferase
MKHFLKQICPPILLDYFKKIVYHENKYTGLAELDKKIEKYLGYENGYFVELGANDGVSQSNTYYFEKYKAWSGVLVEPTPHNYLKCLANRSPKTMKFCNACVSFDYSEKFVEIAFANLMSSSINLESDLSDPFAHAKSGEQFLNKTDRVFTFGAVAKTLNQILIDAGAPRVIDLLSLDVEGSEIEVLKGINHETFRFKYICVECRNSEKMNFYLNSHGYQLVEKLSHHDYLYKSVGLDS